VTTKMEGRAGERDLIYKKQGVCADWWWKLRHVYEPCRHSISIIGLLCWLEGLGLAALVSGGGQMSQWFAVVAVVIPRLIYCRSDIHNGDQTP
jgi:hypothetical protein